MKLKSRVLFVFLIALFLINPGGVDAAEETIRLYPTDDSLAQLYDDDNIRDWDEARNFQGEISREPLSDGFGNDAGRIMVRSDDGSGFYRIYRVSKVFDLSTIPDHANIIEVGMHLVGISSNPDKDLEIVITSHYRSNISEMSKSDWHIQNYGTHAFARGALKTGNTPTAFLFDQQGLNYVKSAQGNLTLGILTSYDFDDIEPNVNTAGATWYSSETQYSDYLPYLEITYEVPDVEPENEYPLYTQIESPFPSIEETATWADDEMPCGTISVCGCTISSLVSAADEYDFDFDVMGQKPTPATINSYLKSIGGYNASGVLNWLAASAYFGEFASDGTLTTRLQYPPKFIASDVSTEMQSALGLEDKIVLAFEELNAVSGEGHFVWIPEYSLGTYLVRDPLWYETKTADDEVSDTETQKDYGNDFDEARVYTVLNEPEPFSDTSIEVFVRGTAELLYKNALGQKVGYEDGSVLIDMGRAEYGNISVIPTDETSVVSGGGKTLLIYEAGKEFTIDVVGVGSGEYEMEFYTISKTGEITSFTFGGLTFPGVKTTFRFNLETKKVTEEPITYEQFLLIIESVMADQTLQQQKFFEKWAEKMFEDMETKTVSQALQTIETFGKLLVAKKVDSPALLTVLERLSVE